ncbi:pyrophosphatase PpaX [Bacillus thermophilus]|uniref:Pyrophosphatase PpaX n=1 Tax=Siminovitchia thermophila TaxID=1245522 RepID=A0ABS2R2J4_9BACI|nr:pyrophosphatase PpaX [Siminovitchia thermophila]MBM7713868.1 pyrophosphatase PpaX [Siminovitchia thermophila]
MNEQITTILFDLDGTLLDTNELIVTSYLHTFEQFFPGRFKREDVMPFLGPPLYDAFESVDPDKAEEMVKIYRDFNMEKHDLLVREFEGVFETIRTLHENDMKMAIVSTKIRKTVVKGLKLTGLDQFFDVIITLDDVEKAKPDPEPLLKALGALESEPHEAIMIGDNYHDILGGKNAGTFTCGVAWSLKGKDYLEQFHPDFMLKKMPDLLDIVKVGVQ